MEPSTPTPDQQQPQQPLQPETPETPQYSPMTPTPGAAPASMPAGGEDPGKTLGIVGFVLAFVFSPVGLVLSIIGYNKSKSAGIKNGLALAGIILNSVFIVLGIVFGIIIALTAFAGVQQLAKVGEETASVADQNNAKTKAGEELAIGIVKYIDDGIAAGEPAYPKTFKELNIPDKITLSTTAMVAAPKDANTIEFYTCDGGNRVGYWDYGFNEVWYEATNGLDEHANCVLATS
jgi:hypothetical protein